MNYIQNKLDEISKKFTTNIILSLSLPDEMIDYVERTINKNIEQAITEVYNKGQTDYQNHILEMVKNSPNDKINCLKKHIAGESIWLSKRDILNILQDTNPKE